MGSYAAEKVRRERVGWILESGMIVRPPGAPTNPQVRARWTWRCPGCGAEISGELAECIACNAGVIDPVRLAEREAQARYLAHHAPRARRSATRVG